jgi:hypothetical protein
VHLNLALLLALFTQAPGMEFLGTCLSPSNGGIMAAGQGLQPTKGKWEEGGTIDV